MEGVARALLIPAAIYLAATLLCFIALTAWGAAIDLRQQRIESVMEGSGAEQAGLRHGDELVSIDGEPADVDHPARELVLRSGGRPVRVRVIRSGAEQELIVQPRDGVLGVHLLPIERCERYSAGRALWFGLLTPARNGWNLVRSGTRRLRAEISGSVGIRYPKELACARRNAYIANVAGGLGILSLLALPVSVAVAIRRGRMATPSSRSPR